MRVLIWHGDIETTVRWQVAFAKRHHVVQRVQRAEAAIELLRKEQFDVLLFDLFVEQESGLAVALMAEFHQPGIAAVLISDQGQAASPSLFARLSCLRCVLGAKIPTEDLIMVVESFDESGAPSYDLTFLPPSTRSRLYKYRAAQRAMARNRAKIKPKYRAGPLLCEPS